MKNFKEKRLKRESHDKSPYTQHHVSKINILPYLVYKLLPIKSSIFPSIHPSYFLMNFMVTWQSSTHFTQTLQHACHSSEFNICTPFSKEHFHDMKSQIWGVLFQSVKRFLTTGITWPDLHLFKVDSSFWIVNVWEVWRNRIDERNQLGDDENGFVRKGGERLKGCPYGQREEDGFKSCFTGKADRTWRWIWLGEMRESQGKIGFQVSA